MRPIRLSTVVAAAAAALVTAVAAPAQAATSVVPAAPTNVINMVLAPAGGLSLTWNAPSYNGGSTITGYTVLISPGSLTYTSATTYASVPAADLIPGTTYSVQVKATNAIGTGSASVPLTINYYTAPGAPTDVDAVGGDEQISVTWEAPVSDGGKAITGYTASASDGGFFSTPLSCSTTGETACTITGVTNDVTYTVTVTATNGLTGFPLLPGVEATPTSGDPCALDPQSSPACPGYIPTDPCALDPQSSPACPGYIPTDPCALDPQSSPTCPGYIPPVTVPGIPTGVSAVAGDRQVKVSWSAPASDGGAAITGYRVSTFPSGKTCSTTGALSCTVTGLNNGTSYTFTVVAINSAGSGTGGSVSLTPQTVPGVPASASATAGDGQVTVSWTAPDSDGGSAVTGYTVTAFPGGHSCSTTGELSCTVKGLTNGTAYSFLVAATNNAGSGDAAQADATPFTIPGAPSGVTASAGDASATVTWSAAAGNGSAVTGYTVTSTPGGRTCSTVGALSCLVTGLTNGTAYTFTVTASNDAGSGAASAPSAAVTPFTTPDAPTGVSATAGEASATVTWSAAADNGSAVTGYTVTATPGGATCSTTGALSCTVTGLTNGTAYTFTVTASNAAGVGRASAASGPVTARTNPGAPTAVSAIAGDGSATVSWSAPDDDGGAEVTSYEVTASPGGATCTATAPETSCTVQGLDNFTFYTFTVTASNEAGASAASDPSDRVVPHSDEFQVWLPNMTVARDGDTQVWIFGAIGVPSVTVRIGNVNFDATPDEYGVAILDYNAAEMTQWVRTGTIRVIAKAVRVNEDGSKVKLRATALFYAPSVTMGTKWRAGKQVTVRVRSAAPDSSLSFRIGGVEVCATDANERGRAACTFDAPEEGDYTLEVYVLHGEEDGQLIGAKDFTVLPSGRRPV